MKSTLIFFLLLSSTVSFASPAPADSENYLWSSLFKGFTKPAFRRGCATTKVPGKIEICAVEVYRKSPLEELNAYFLTSVNGKTGKFKIVNVSKWIFLRRTTDYVFNTEFYKRTLRLEDLNGRQSDLTEVFDYSDLGSDGFSIRTITFTGELPDGTLLPVLDNHYLHPFLVKNYHE